MGRTERKLKKKTRLERLEVYISRLSQFNQNAMHEVGKLAAALRYYADGGVWGGIEVPEPPYDGSGKTTKHVIWTPKEDGPSVARAVLNSLGLPWDKFPTKDGQPVDPQQAGVPSVLKNIGEEMRAHKAGLAEDDRSQSGLALSAGEDEAVYGRYTEDGVIPLEEEHGLGEKVNPLDVPMEAEHGPEEINTLGEVEHKVDDGIPPEEK